MRGLLLTACCLALCAAGAACAADDTRAQMITCPTGDDTQPLKLAESVPAPGQPQAAALVSYYRAGPVGVFAPRGWSCHAWLGTGGSMLLVTPRPVPPPYFPLPAVNGPAVLMQLTDSSESGRFHVALVAARVFPLLGRELITQVRDEHLISDSSFDVQPYADDRLQYLTDRLLAYTTPAHHAGLGTDSLFETGDLPIRGVMLFSPGGEIRSLTELRVRLPEAQRALGDAILDLETRCFQLQQGCRGL